MNIVISANGGEKTEPVGAAKISTDLSPIERAGLGVAALQSRNGRIHSLQNRQYQKTAATAGCLFIECTHTIIFTRW